MCVCRQFLGLQLKKVANFYNTIEKQIVRSQLEKHSRMKKDEWWKQLSNAQPGAAGGEKNTMMSAEDLVQHRGDKFRYAARVHPAFGDRLSLFEGQVVQLAVEHFGRAPTRMRHGGTYNCRRARGRRGRISEHAFGNAIDLEGFDFGRLPRDGELPAGLHRRYRRPFQVRIGPHWAPRRSRDQPQADFLHALAETLRRRPDIFRGIVGPPRPRHANHLHLDASPWRYTMFSYEHDEE